MADARQYPVVATLQDFVCHCTSIWVKPPFDVSHEHRRRGPQRSRTRAAGRAKPDP
jgi:hypothetical protein